jgi:hypothetical protein
MHVPTALLIGALSLSLSAVLQPPRKPKVYFGEVSPEGAASPPPTKELADSYRHMREEAAGRQEVRTAFELATDPRHADILVSIVERRVRVTGLDSRRSIDRRMARDVAAREENVLTASLTVPGSAARVDLDGAKGAEGSPSFKQLACRIVRQTAEWVAANQDTLKARRSAQERQTASDDQQQFLARVVDYVTVYRERYSGIVAEEDYRQSTPASQVRLRSDLLLVKNPEDEGWVSFRDVFEVDGSRVRDREDRLQKPTRAFVASR